MTIEEQLAIAKDVLEKCEAATPGEWGLSHEKAKTDYKFDHLNIIQLSAGGKNKGRIARMWTSRARTAFNAESITALHNHAPAALEGWVRAVEFCNEPRDDNQFSDHPQERFNSGYAEACRDILALLAARERSNDEQA